MTKFKSFAEFKDDYEEQSFIDKVHTRYYPLKPLNPKQVQRYYLQYVKKWDKAYGGGILTEAKEQSDDSKLSAFARERDEGCRLLRILYPDEISEWQKYETGLGKILDVAHVFGKGAYPWMRYEKKNVVTLNRFSHICMDRGYSPITGKAITDEERIRWWKRIINNDADWEYLESRSKERN